MVVLLFLLLLLPDIYLWASFLRNMHWGWTVLMVTPTVIAIAMMFLVRSPLYQAWMFRVALSLILITVFPKLLFTIISLCRFLIPIAGAAKYVNIVGGIFAAAGFGIAAYGMGWGWKRLVTNDIDIQVAGLPKAFDGYRIIHLSDFHIGTYMDAPECVEHIVEEVNKQNADLIVFTGDMVNTDPKEMDMFMNVLSKMRAKDGIYSIMGNHDYCTYKHYDSPRGQVEAVKALQDNERKLGWKVLLNENDILRRGNDSIAIVGVENSSKPPFPDYGDLKKAQAGLPDGICKILLSHDPTHWRRKVLPETDIPLQLSGHTHATQFEIFGWSPASFAYDEWGGLYKTGSQSGGTTGVERALYVSTGTGGNLAFRFGVYPEIVVLTLRR